MEKRLKNILVGLFVAMFIVSLCFNVRFFSTKQEMPFAISDTTRITIIDTLKYIEPKPKQEILVDNVVEKLPTVVSQSDTSAEAIPDSVEVVIPITQQVYEDSTYTAYVSGYKQHLDSIFVYPRQEIITIHQITKPKRWNVGIQVGYGVSVKGTPQFSPYIGIGVSYNLFNF